MEVFNMVSRVKAYKKAIISSIALFLAILLISNSVLSLLIQITLHKSTKDDAQSNAVNYLVENSEYMTKEEVERKLEVLRLLSPSDWKDYNSQADIYIAKEEYDKASKSIKKAIDLSNKATKEERSSLYLKAGCVYTLLNKYKDALSYLEKSTSLNSNNQKAYLIMAEIYSEQDNVDKVIEIMSIYAKKNPKDISSQELLAKAYLSKGNYESAIKWFEKVKNNSDSADSHYYYGLCAIQLNKYKKAEESLTKALEMNSEYGDAYYYRAICRLKEDKYSVALKDLEKAQTLVEDAKFRSEIENLIKQIKQLSA